MSIGVNIIKLTKILRDNTTLIQYDDGNTFFYKGPFKNSVFLMDSNIATISDSNDKICFPSYLIENMKLLNNKVYMELDNKKLTINIAEDE